VLKLYTAEEVAKILTRDFGAEKTLIDTGFALLWQLPNKRFLTVPHPEPGFEKYTPSELNLLLGEAKRVASLPQL